METQEGSTEQVKTLPEDPGYILVVEDNPLVATVLRNLFTAAGYAVRSAKNGEEALKLLDQDPVDLILSDVMMPKMDGYELFKELRELPGCSEIPFILLTALSSEQEALKGKGAGVDDYVKKPFDPKDLLTLVSGKLERSRKLRKQNEQRYDSYRKQVIHTLSHEFRTPLVAINTGTELLLDLGDGMEKAKTQDLLEAIQRGGKRLERLVNDFMVIQQLEAGTADRMYNKGAKKTSIRDLFAEVEREARLRFEMFQEYIHWKNGFGSQEAHVFKDQVTDIVGRLIDNALKFSPENKEVQVEGYEREGNLVIEVRDRGLGIDPEQIEEALNLFGQIGRDDMEQQGGGLGLPIASRYAEIHSGKLEFERRNGGGSITRLVLPVVFTED